MQLIVRQLGNHESHMAEVILEIQIRDCACSTRVGSEERIGAVDGKAERGFELLSLLIAEGRVLEIAKLIEGRAKEGTRLARLSVERSGSQRNQRSSPKGLDEQLDD